MNQTSSIDKPDFDEAPELAEADLERAVYRLNGQPVGQPEWQQSVQSCLRKKKINLTLDPDIVAWFKQRAGGRGYQTLINATLRDAMQRTTLEETLRRVLREEMHRS